MLAIKEGVSLSGLRPEMLVALQVADGVYSQHDVECVVTSGTDSKHGNGSLHYVGLAVDLRIRDFASKNVTVVSVVRQLKNLLGKQYDVVQERTHIHIEFQPK